MSLFKDLIKSDVTNIFINNDEFSEIHVIDGEEMDAIIDSNELIERTKSEKDNMDGIYTKKILIYVKEEQFGAPPKYGATLDVDNKSYTVCDVANECGIYSITLEANDA